MGTSSIVTFSKSFQKAFVTTFIWAILICLFAFLLGGCEALDAFFANPDNVDKVGQVGDTVATFVPPPWDFVLSGVVGIALGLIRARQRKIQLDKVVSAVDQAKNSALGTAGVVNFNDPAVVKLLQDAMGSKVRKAVNDSQSGSGLPV